MEFLKAVLGDELYATFAEKLNAWNGNEENEGKTIKLANLASGEYVGKGKFDSLNATLASKEQELTAANSLVETLKKGGSEAQKSKIAEYEQTVANLQAQLAQEKLSNAIALALRDAKATEPDFLTWKLKEDGEELTLDENGKVNGIDEKIAALKTAHPGMFESAGKKTIVEQRLPDSNGESGLSHKDFMAMSYEKRAELAEIDPETYEKIKN